MKRKLLAILAINLFVLLTLLSTGSASAQGAGQWITNYTITDLRTGQILLQSGGPPNATILAGSDLNVTFTIQVVTSSPSTTLRLTTYMGHSAIQGTYWELHTKDFPGLNATAYNPNQQSVSFSQITGTLSMSCYGTIDSGITLTPLGSGITLDKKTDSQLVWLGDPSDNQLDQVRVNVIDAKIDTFNGLYSAAQTKLNNMMNSGVDPAYTTLYQTMLEYAYNQASQGFVDNGITAVNQLAAAQGSTNPITTGTPIESTLFIPVVAALAVIVVLVIFLFMRARGKVGYSKMVIEDQVKDLEGLTLRVAKVDKNLTVSLESVKERLQSLIGE